MAIDDPTMRERLAEYLSIEAGGAVEIEAFERRSPEGKAEAFLKSTGADPVAMLHLLDSAVDTPPEALAMIPMPVLVVAGEQDDDSLGKFEGGDGAHTFDVSGVADFWMRDSGVHWITGMERLVADSF